MKQNYCIAGHVFRISGENLCKAVESMAGFKPFVALDAQQVFTFQEESPTMAPPMISEQYSFETEGVGAFRLNKNILYKFFGWSPDLNYKKNENSVQTGSNLMGGVTLGYVHTFKSNPHWSVEVNWSMGRQWARYDDHLYDANGTPTGYVPMNGSAEYMPFYRGGIYVAYKW